MAHIDSVVLGMVDSALRSISDEVQIVSVQGSPTNLIEITVFDTKYEVIINRKPTPSLRNRKDAIALRTLSPRMSSSAQKHREKKRQQKNKDQMKMDV